MCPFGHRPSQALCRGRVVKMSPSGSSEGDEASWVVPARNRSLLRPKHSPRRSPRPAPTTTRARTASSTAPMTAAISCGVGIASSTPRQPWPRRQYPSPRAGQGHRSSKPSPIPRLGHRPGGRPPPVRRNSPVEARVSRQPRPVGCSGGSSCVIASPRVHGQPEADQAGHRDADTHAERPRQCRDEGGVLVGGPVGSGL